MKRYIDDKEVIETVLSLVQEPKVKEGSVSFPLVGKEESNCQNDKFAKASRPTYNLPTTGEYDVTFVANQHFKDKSEPEYESKLKAQQNCKLKSKKKGRQRRKYYNSDKIEMDKKHTFLNVKKLKRLDQLKELLKIFQMCLPKNTGYHNMSVRFAF